MLPATIYCSVACGESQKNAGPEWAGVIEIRLSPMVYSEGLVFFRPTTRSPSFHSPRFLSNSMRSNRLSTLRFTADALDDL